MVGRLGIDIDINHRDTMYVSILGYKGTAATMYTVYYVKLENEI